MKYDSTIDKNRIMNKLTSLITNDIFKLCQNIFIHSKLGNNIECRIQKTVSNFR